MKKSLILLLILASLLIALFLSHSRSPIQRRVPLFSFPIEDVYSISMSDRYDSLFIHKDIEKGDWYALHPVKVKLSQEHIATFFSKIKGVQRFTKLLTDQPRDFDFYNVSPNFGRRVIFYDKDGFIINDNYFGMAQLTNYGTVRKASEIKVYEISQNIMHDFNPFLGQWREQTIVSFDSETADSLYVWYLPPAPSGATTSTPTVQAGGGRGGASFYKLTKENNQWHYTDKNESFALTPVHLALHRAFSLLEVYNTTAFVDYEWETHKEYFDNPAMIIQIFNKDETTTLSIARFTSQASLIKVNDNTETLYLHSNEIFHRLAIPASEYKKEFKYSL